MFTPSPKHLSTPPQIQIPMNNPVVLHTHHTCGIGLYVCARIALFHSRRASVSGERSISANPYVHR